MKLFSFILSVLGVFIGILNSALAEAEVGKPAPEFELSNHRGETIRLADFNGKWLVLEWFNNDCPFVVKHYKSNNMQTLQKKYTEKGVQWVSVVSSAPGKQGHVTEEQAKKLIEQNKAHVTHMLLDPKGIMGKAYGAKTTPHMFVINPQGVVVYAGAIDDNSSSNPKVIRHSKNYVAAALDQGMAGQPIKVTSSRPYGCSVKY
jgi:peroxiredoxin